MTKIELGDNAHVDIEADDLTQILNELSGKKHEVSEANGRLRSAIKAVLDDREWNAKGLAKIREIDAMSDTARVDFMRTFLPLFKVMLDHKWASEMQDLISDTEDEDDEVEDE